MEHPSVKNGIFGAIAVIIVYLVLWFIDPKILIKYGSWFGIAIGLYFMYRAAKEARDINEGYISFNDAFKYLFLTMALLTIIVSLFNYVLYNFIDPGLLEIQKEVALETAQKMADAFGNEDMMEEISDKIDETAFKLTLVDALKGWVYGLILGAIASAIMGAIMKKKDPSFDEFA